MYADYFKIRLVGRDGAFVGQGDIVYEESREVRLDHDHVPLEPVVDGATEFLADREIDVFNASITGTNHEQGGSRAGVQLLLELRSDLEGVAWGTLASLLASFLADIANRKDDD